MANEKPLPEGASVLIPRLFCQEPAGEIEFCKTVFGAAELVSRPGPDGRVMHALLTISGAMIMIEAEVPSLPSRAPAPDGSSPVVLYVYVGDVDATVEQAVAAGGKVLFPVADQFWGDRMGWVMDPSGHTWTIATRIEETSAELRDKRWEDVRSQM
jgi:PhnB protein